MAIYSFRDFLPFYCPIGNSSGVLVDYLRCVGYRYGLLFSVIIGILTAEHQCYIFALAVLVVTVLPNLCGFDIQRLPRVRKGHRHVAGNFQRSTIARRLIGEGVILVGRIVFIVTAVLYGDIIIVGSFGKRELRIEGDVDIIFLLIIIRRAINRYTFLSSITNQLKFFRIFGNTRLAEVEEFVLISVLGRFNHRHRVGLRFPNGIHIMIFKSLISSDLGDRLAIIITIAVNQRVAI